MIKRSISVLLSFILLICVLMFGASASNTYTINNATVRYDLYASSPDDSSAYASYLYKTIWGQELSFDFSDSANSLRQLENYKLVLNEENLKKYVSFAPVGACIRLCNDQYLHGTDKEGHSQIIVAKDNKGFTVLEGGLSEKPYCREQYYTWDGYCRLWSEYRYIKYIKWPNASIYTEHEHSYDDVGVCTCGNVFNHDTSFNGTSAGVYTLKKSRNIRTAPYTEADKAPATLEAGEEVKVTGTVTNAQGSKWYKVSYGENKTGYLYFEWLTYVRALDCDIDISVTWPYEGQKIPQSGHDLEGMITSSTPIAETKVYVDGVRCITGGENDSPLLFSSSELAESVAFETLSGGAHTLKIVATDTNGGTSTLSRTFEVRSSSTNTTNEQQIFNYLTNVLGCNQAVAAGILANIEHESSFNPMASVIDTNGLISYGICQWNGGRYEALKKYAGSEYNTVAGQLKYLKYELEHAEWYAWKQMQGIPNTADGAAIAGSRWAKYFERCAQFSGGKDMYEARGEKAKTEYWPKYKPGSHQHAYDAAVTEATCTTWGYSTFTCQCGYTTREQYVAPLGHTFVNWKCTVCGVNDPDYVESVPFYDVPKTAYFYDPVRWAVAKKITNGISDTAFGPEQFCTRGHIVTFLWRAAGSPKAYGNNPFVDVAKDSYYYDAVLWAVEQGITNGVSETSFAPDSACNRAQIVTFLYRMADEPKVSGKSSFKDVADEKAYYYKPVLWAIGQEITNGTSDNTFSPDNTCTRGQAVTFLHRFYN